VDLKILATEVLAAETEVVALVETEVDLVILLLLTLLQETCL
jgi:hypothetical protein